MHRNIQSIKELSCILAEINDKKIIEKLFISILTKKEIKTLSSRWELVKLLYKGINQRQISRLLNISLCKITRGSKELKKRDSVLKKIIKEYKIIN